MKRPAVIAIISVLALAGLALARGQGQSGSGNGMQVNQMKGTSPYSRGGEPVAQALQLKEEEKEKLAEAQDKHLSEMQDLRKVLKEQRQALMEIMTRKNLSVTEAREQFNKVEDTLARMNEKRFELQLQERELLGAERFGKLLEMEKQDLEQGRGKQ